jgi:hypothetical protein
MKGILKTSCIAGVFCLCLALPAAAQQQSSAAATPMVPSSGRPSSIQIKQNVLNQKRRALNSQIEVAQRCIKNASQAQTLRDPEGNLNIVPKTDLVNCTRTLEALLRQLDGLAREAGTLAQDAQVGASALQRKQKLIQAQKKSALRRLRGTGL